MLSRTLILALVVSLVMMTTVVAFDYEEVNKRDDEPNHMKLNPFLVIARPRLRKYRLDTNDRDKDLASDSVEMLQQDVIQEPRLIRATRLKELSSLDSSFNLQFRPRFGKRTYIYGNRFKTYPTAENDYQNRLMYIAASR